MLSLGAALVLGGLSLLGPTPSVRHSVGTPRSGTLVGAQRLRSGPGYFVHDRTTSYGTPTTVAHLRAVLESLHEAHPAAVLRVGDLSRREGGALVAHQSHQSGRDVDLGLVPPRGTDRFGGRFERAPAERIGMMDERATLHLLRLLAATAGEPGGVQWIMLDYGLQQRLHDTGVAAGLEPAELDALLQYPHGRRASRGLVRHYPGHRNHMHVRFACAPGERACRGRTEPPRP